MFHKRAKEIFRDVKEFVADKTVNIGKIQTLFMGDKTVGTQAPQPGDKIVSIGVIQKETRDRFVTALDLFYEVSISILKANCSNAKQINIAGVILQSTFAQAYGLTDCALQASIVLTKFLEQQLVTDSIPSIEMIQIKGPKTKKVVYFEYNPLDNKLHKGFIEGHCFIIWGRSATSEISQISSWAGMCDTWSDGFFWDRDAESEADKKAPGWEDITHGYFKLEEFESFIRMERNLTRDEWLFIFRKIT